MMWTRLKDKMIWLKEKLGLSLIRKLLWAFGFLVILYYPLGMALIHVIDDDGDYGLEFGTKSEKRSAAVDVAVALIDREVNQHSWISNDPFFKPGAALDNMSNYQQGIISAIARFSFELVDQLGRTRGSSKADPDLQEVSGLLQYPGDKWFMDFSTSLLPVSTSEAQYRRAKVLLEKYNDRLEKGEAIFERRADNLLATLDRIALDLGASSAAIDQRIEDRFACVLDTNADDLFYHVKGQAYAYSQILKGLRRDFTDVIATRDLKTTWDEMRKSMDSVVALDPSIVSNCDADGFFFQNHLASEGFYLLRARTQLKEITNILLK